MKALFQYLRNDYHLVLTLLLGLVSFWGAIVYLLYQLNGLGVFLALILTLLSGFFIIRYLRSARQAESIVEPKRFYPWLTIVYILMAVIFLVLVIESRTGRSLVSPFEALPIYSLGLYLVLTLVAMILVYRSAKYSTLVLIAHFLLSFSILPLVYSAGYGYDPFLHRAALKAIDVSGAIYPKTFYYSGQYSLEIIIHRLSAIDWRWIDNFLVPVLAAFFLPLVSLKVGQGRGKHFAGLLLLLWPFSFLTYTVPQNLAYLFLLLVILLSLERRKGNLLIGNLLVMLVLSLAAVLTQPLAGLPALFLTLALFLETKYRLAYWGLWAQAIFWPLFFWLFLPTKLAWPHLSFGHWLENVGSWWENIIYSWGDIRWLILLAVILFSFWLANKRKHLYPYVFSAGSLFLAYGLCLFWPSDNLASTEKYDYANRLLIAGALFLLPLLLAGGEFIRERLNREKLISRMIIIFFLTVFITASFYLAYPRQDAHFSAKGYSVSASDLQAVNYIDSVGSDRNYIVLANQQVGAAAISSFGFKRYYGPYFYYSTQSGGELQKHFTTLMADPRRETVISAMDLVGVNEVYVVVNNYWWDFERVVRLMKFISDDWQKIDNGEVFVFWFKR